MSEWQLPVPELTAGSVEATGAYTFAFTICAIIYAVAILIWRVPGLSRSTRSEARSTWTSALISVAILASLLSVEFMISTLNSRFGIPDWRQVLDEAPRIWQMGEWYVSFVQAALVPFIVALALLGTLATVFAPLMLVVNLIHGVFSYFGWFLVFVGIVAVAAMLLAKILQIIVRLASAAHLFIAAGVAMFPIKWTRRIGVSLIIFGLVMYYGLPVLLGAITPAQAPPTSPEELARANLLKSLNRETTPVNLVVASEYGGILPWAYLEMNSSVEYEVPLNLTESSLPEGSRIIGTISYDNKTFQLAVYNFTYTRFYNGSFTNPYEAGPLDLMYPQLYLIRSLVNTWNLVEKRWSVLGRTMLYKHSTVNTLWYLGYELNVSNPEISIEGGLDMENPDEDLKDVTSAQEYYDKIYAKSPIHVVEAKAVDPLNQNSTALIHYSPEIYSRDPHNRIERLDKGVYLYKFRLPRESYHCWVSRVENVTDPETNQSRLIYYYRARATYRGESDELYLSYLDGSNPRAEITFYRAADRREGGYEPSLIISASSPGAVVGRGLARGFHPIKVVNQYVLEEEFGGIGESQVKAAEEGGYLPGEVVPEGENTYTHVIEGPREVVLDPNPSVNGYRVGGYATRTSGELEGRCPSLPGYIDVEARVEFSADDTNAWSPLPLMEWEPMAEWGERSYHLMYEVDPKHELTSKPELLEINGAPILQLLKGGLGGGFVGALRLIPFIGDLIKWVAAMVMPLMVADGLCALLGGISIGGTILSAGGRAFARTMGGLYLVRGGRAPSVNQLFSLPREVLDRDMGARIEQMKLKQSEQALFRQYADVTRHAMLEAMREPTRRYIRTRKSLFGGRLKIPYIVTEYPRARALMEFRQSASRLVPEQAVLAQKLAHPNMVRLTREGAKELMGKVDPALMYTEEGRKAFKTLLFGGGLSRAKVSELFVKGDMRVDGRTGRNIVMLGHPITRLVYGMFLPEAYPAVYKAEKERLMRDLSFESRFGYAAAKHIAHLPEDQLPEHLRARMGALSPSIDEAAKPEGLGQAGPRQSDNTLGEVLRHNVSINYSRGDLHAEISVEGGRTIEIHSEASKQRLDQRGLSGADRAIADVIGTARAVYETAPREDVDDFIGTSHDHERIQELAEHTHGKGYDWWWTPGPALSAGEGYEPKPEDFLGGEAPAAPPAEPHDERDVARDASLQSIASGFGSALGSQAEQGHEAEPSGEPAGSGGSAEAEPGDREPDLIDHYIDDHDDHVDRGPADGAHPGPSRDLARDRPSEGVGWRWRRGSSSS